MELTGVRCKSKNQETFLVLDPLMKINFRGSWIISSEVWFDQSPKKPNHVLWCIEFWFGKSPRGLGSSSNHVSWGQLFNNQQHSCYCYVLLPQLGTSLEKGMATHSSVLAWRIPWTEEPGGLQSMESWRVIDNWAANTFTFYHHNMDLAIRGPKML